MDRPSPRGGYSTREVATLLGLSQAQVRSCARAGFVAPQVGPRGELLFSFQDLVLLRTAKALLAARIPNRRIRVALQNLHSPLPPRVGPRGDLLFSFQDLVLLRTAKALLAARIPSRRIRVALQNLHSQLPQGQPLTAVRISAQGHHVVARDGGEAWHPESGQTLLDFDVADLAREAAALEPRRPALQTAADWYEHGVELEAGDAPAPIAAYRRALAIDPDLADAHLNLGRLLHEGGDPARAQTHYRRALALDPGDALGGYN